MKRMSGGESGREERMKDADGKLLVDERETRERWASYFSEFLNMEDLPHDGGCGE